jgi:AcrR family transcriptional regulator
MSSSESPPLNPRWNMPSKSTRSKSDKGVGASFSEKNKRPAAVEKSTRQVRSSSAERSQEILDVSQKLFLSHGIENVTTRLIATTIGISQPALYKHFSSKQEILDRLVNQVFGELTQVLLELDGRREKWLEQSIGAYIRFGLKHPDEFRLAFLVMRKPGDIPKNGEPTELQKLRRTSFHILEEHVRVGIEEGWIRDDLGSSHSLSQCLWAGMHGIVALRLTRHRFPWDDLENQIVLHTRILLSGILVGEDRP